MSLILELRRDPSRTRDVLTKSIFLGVMHMLKQEKAHLRPFAVTHFTFPYALVSMQARLGHYFTADENYTFGFLE